MSEIWNVVDGIRQKIDSSKDDNKDDIIKLIEEFVRDNSNNNSIPKDEIMKFLGNLGTLLVKFCMYNSFCGIEEAGISSELKDRLKAIMVNNGYKSIEPARAYIIDSLLNNHDGYIGCQICDIGVYIRDEDIKSGILDDASLLADYVIRNFLYHLDNSKLSSVYYDFSVVYYEKNNNKSK